MKRNSLSWVLAILGASTIAALLAQTYLAWQAVRSGESPSTAYWHAQQIVWRVFLNPWVFAAYSLTLLRLFMDAVRRVKEEKKQTASYWYLAAVLVALVVYVSKFVHARGH